MLRPRPMPFGLADHPLATTDAMELGIHTSLMVPTGNPGFMADFQASLPLMRPGKIVGAAPPPPPPGSGPTQTIAPPPPPPKPASGVAPKTLEFRSIDGSGNHQTKTDLNAAGTDYSRLGPASFADGLHEMPTDLPNARTVSNLVVAGKGSTPNAEGLSGMMYAWGQFIDHDLVLTNADGTTKINIAVPAGDPTLVGSISMTRAIIDPATGHDGKPAAAVNAITGWIDGSMVYGSDAATAAALRTADGHMLTSAGNNLPMVGGFFAAGDIRAQENPDLTALQTLFVREHNFHVDRLKAANPTWSGDQLYQHARAIVSAEISHITYDEFLPHLVGKGAMTAYRGYKPNVDARISEEFAGAAFRFGHSIVGDTLQRIDEQGRVVGDPMSLRESFFQSAADFVADGGPDGLLRNLASDLSNAMDVHLVEDLRSFLFSNIGVGMDLAAINIQRGRDLGLGSLNETRKALGLTAYTSFEQITSDTETANALRAAYGTVDKVELWIGGLAENHVRGAMVGQTFKTIIAHQFEALRDGDRLWYESQGFDRGTLDMIKRTSLSDIIERNTDTDHMQADAFVYYDRMAGRAGGGVAETPGSSRLIIGADGRDTLVGGAADDLLVAGSGAQRMTGGAGRDVFLIDEHGTNAVITDFRKGQDRIEIDHDHSHSFRDLRITADERSAVVDLDGTHIVLQGVNPASLSAADFIFS